MLRAHAPTPAFADLTEVMMTKESLFGAGSPDGVCAKLEDLEARADVTAADCAGHAIFDASGQTTKDATNCATECDVATSDGCNFKDRCCACVFWRGLPPSLIP